MRSLTPSILSLVALTFALPSCAPSSSSDEGVVAENSSTGSCGVERWSVKVGTDSSASSVNLTPQDTTIAALDALPVPSGLNQNAGRLQPNEFKTFRLTNVTFTQYKLENDSDYHLILTDGSSTMIVEIPDPLCASSSVWASQINSARSTFDASFNATTSFQTANVPVTVVGVGFFDLLHGQTGVAPNGFELHSVLSICFGTNCAGGATPDFSLSSNPTSVTAAQGASGTTSITATGTNGFSGTVALSASGLPSGATASFSPTSVSSGGSSTLTLHAGAATSAGTYNVTVTGTSGTLTHTTAVSFTVTATATPDFSLSANPSSVSAVQGASANSTISASPINGFSGTINLSASGVPAGASAGFSVTSISASGSSTLTLSAGTAAAGTYNVTVTGTSGSLTHTTSVSFTVTSSGGGSGITNGGFESGLTGWTSSGTTAAVSTGCHSGSGCARAGSTSPTNGDSSVSQAFTAPANSTSLSFWYQVNCPDSVTYDWATATLKDNAAGTTSTILAQTCTNTGAWTQVTTSITAGKSYTLTLTSHDDNYATDPTYTLFDDVTITTSGPPTNDFSISASPGSLSIVKGNSGNSTISTAVTSGSAASVSLTASVSPSGPTVSLSPTSVTAGGSSSLTISTSSAAAGSYTVTVTGTEGSKTHSTSVALTVTNPVTGGITNGGFETGTFAGWTQSGAVSSITTISHSGTYAAFVGSSSPTNGDSSIAQTFTVPTGKSQLSIWYANKCPDTVTYDWATITLLDNTTGVTTTVLPRTCAASSFFTNVTASVTAGHSYTLTLTNHDDNYSSDPTNTIFDDITLN